MHKAVLNFIHSFKNEAEGDVYSLIKYVFSAKKFLTQERMDCISQGFAILLNTFPKRDLLFLEQKYKTTAKNELSQRIFQDCLLNKKTIQDKRLSCMLKPFALFSIGCICEFLQEDLFFLS